MSPRTIYPRTINDCVDLLVTLGFTKKLGIGRGKHPEKYFNRKRKNVVTGDRPFIIIPHEYYDQLGMKIMKKLQNWSYTKEEIEGALRGLKPLEKECNVETDAELEESI
jgi:hypothetical protein